MSVSKRCGCRDEQGRALPERGCPQLRQFGHGRPVVQREVAQ